MNEARPLYEIAQDVRSTWKPRVNPAAEPYLQAMFELDKITDKYFMDDATGIVSYFLSNASTYRGDDARRIKAELKGMIGR